MRYRIEIRTPDLDPTEFRSLVNRLVMTLRVFPALTITFHRLPDPQSNGAEN